MLLSFLYRLLCRLLRLLVRCGVDERDVETVVLRHQLRILHRRGAQPHFTTADRAWLAAAAGLLSRDRRRSFLVGPDALTPVAPRPLAGAPSSPVEATGSSSARSLDQASDPSPRAGEPEVGLSQDQRGTLEARRHDDRHGASPQRPRPGATPDRAALATVPEVAGVRPALPRASIRRAGQVGRPCTGSAPGSTGPAQRRLGDHRRRRTHPRPVASERRAHLHGGRSAAWTRDSGSAGHLSCPPEGVDRDPRPFLLPHALDADEQSRKRSCLVGAQRCAPRQGDRQSQLIGGALGRAISTCCGHALSRFPYEVQMIELTRSTDCKGGSPVPLPWDMRKHSDERGESRTFAMAAAHARPSGQHTRPAIPSERR